MSRNLSQSEWLERNLESARRRVQQLEIDACRIRTDLAELEAANAAGTIAQRAVVDSEQPVAGGPVQSQYDWQPVAASIPEGMEIVAGSLQPTAVVSADPFEGSLDEAMPEGESWITGLMQRSRGIYRRMTSPVMASVFAHAAIMIVAISITVVTIERNDAGPTTTLVLGEKRANETAIFEPQQLADLGTLGADTISPDISQLDVSSPVDNSVIPAAFESTIVPASPGELGLLDAHDTDNGQVPSGKGGWAKAGDGAGAGLGGGKGRGAEKAARSGGRAEQTMFFGTAARGTRFVFVVDNSSSMKGGRLEMAVAELIRTVNGLSPNQSFYVIFVSDRAYKMFYPQHESDMVPATPENKKRLAEWAPRAMLASGKNRELIKAMDVAASLEPQAVYLLWDGDLRYSETVRLDVLTHLTQPNQWNFIVHTLGMGVTSANNEQNLRAIAQSHRGTYRRIDVPVARGR